MRKLAMSLCLCLVATSAQAGNKDNFFSFKTKVVQGQLQMHGHYGKNWTETEVRKSLERDCAGAGKTLAALQLGEVHKRKGQSFVGVCT
ncbi:hypothetical protein [uncultured Roseobacter sp.]|uniref:hypothetical protein n=1 Tax=uncultured Roseobacter sp. TaxID=114847 RepID=UPI00262E7C2E|nr:hypothetical protein [uncultured Roseobacter sp.]